MLRYEKCAIGVASEIKNSFLDTFTAYNAFVICPEQMAATGSYPIAENEKTVLLPACAFANMLYRSS